MKRSTALFCVLGIMAAAVVLPAAAGAADRPVCGRTTLEGKIVHQANGALVCGPGQPMVIREDFARRSHTPLEQRSPLGSWVGFADLQLADEESPLRGEWADKCGRDGDGDGRTDDSPISNSAWRPQESMMVQMINAQVKAANEIVSVGSPLLGAPVDFALTMGDLADNQQYNEIRSFIDLFDGNKMVDPGSGLPTVPVTDPMLDGSRYDGVQAEDVEGYAPLPGAADGGPPVVDDVDPRKDVRLLDLAQRPFEAEGLDGIPWYAVPGNHDVKVQGTIADDAKVWRDLVRRYAIGHTKIMELGVDYQSRVCNALIDEDSEAFQAVFEEILRNPQNAGTTKVIPADYRRLPMYRSDEAKGSGDEESCKALGATDPLHAQQITELCASSWLEEQFDTSGLPAGHGFVEDNRCTDENGVPLERLCYTFERGPLLFIALDSNPAEGLERGNIDRAQWEWLQRTLQDHSPRLDDSGAVVAPATKGDRLITIVTHHTWKSMDNLGPYSSAEQQGSPKFPQARQVDAKTGADLVQLLLHHPNVILHMSGHTHENKVFAHGKADGLPTDGKFRGYWEVNTAAIADAPHQSRMFELSDNGDGTLSIFSVTFEGAVPADARTMNWNDDPTAGDGVNEDWLASFGRELGFNDPQADSTAGGKPGDQNVELLLPAPFDLSAGPQPTKLTYTGDSSAKVGTEATVSAVLTTERGVPVVGRTVTFSRDGRVVTVITDSAGRASGAMKVNGPPRSDLPVVVGFEGDGDLLASSATVPFSATSGNVGGSRIPI